MPDGNPSKKEATVKQEFKTLPPPRPRPVLLVVLSIAFAIWIALLLVDYFLSVYPRRH